MKRYIESATILLAALALASCNKAEEFEYNSDSALQIASVSGISPFDLMQNQASKAVITGDSLPGNEAAKGIGLFVTATDGGAYDGKTTGYSNVKYTFDGSKWSTQSPIYLSSNEGNLYGYFPYNPDVTDLQAIPVQSSLNGTDYLYAKSQTVNHSYKTVDLQMNHALSRLHLTIKKGANFTAGASLSKITLKSTSIDATGTMDLTTGAITAAKKSGETGIVELATDGEITTEGIEKDILLVPANNSEGKKDIDISLMISGKPSSVSLTETGGLDIRSGIQNNVTLTIEDTDIKVTGVDVGVCGEGGGHQMQVGSHTVTVKLAEVSGIEKDIMATAYVEGASVIIKAQAESGRPVECVLTNDKLCEYKKNNNIYTFTISDITSDMTATIGYSVVRSVSLNKDALTLYSNYRLVATVLPETAEDKTLIWSSSDETIATVDQNGYVKAIGIGSTTITVKTKVGGHTATCNVAVKPLLDGALPGVFSVSATKQVLFSMGNLWYGTKKGESKPVLHFEEAQWNSIPTSNSPMDSSHVSHFTWSSTVEKAVGTSSEGNYLFCDESHKQSIDGSDAIFYALSISEWEYLLDYEKFGNDTRRGKHKWATVNGVKGYVIAPDDFTGTIAGSYTDDTALAADNLVFLPAGGFRDGSDVTDVGYCGIYWSSFTDWVYSAYDVFIFNFGAVANSLDERNCGNSVRLVADVADVK